MRWAKSYYPYAPHGRARFTKTGISEWLDSELRSRV